MLAIAVEYITGKAYATEFTSSRGPSSVSQSEPEWPPHPSRLFSALVAGAYQADLNGETRDALEWLESQPAPSIAYGEAYPRTKAITYVPAADRHLFNSKYRQGRIFHTLSPVDAIDPYNSSQPRVFFIWPDAAPSSSIRNALEKVLYTVPCLGSSMSFVRMYLDDNPPEPNMVPDESGIKVLRVPFSGRLKELDQVYEAGIFCKNPGRFQRYRKSRVELEKGPQSTWEHFHILRYVTGPKYPLEGALSLADSLRKAVLSLAGDSASDILHGHGNRPNHCAFCVLPDVGHKYAMGDIKGLGIILPQCASIEEQIELQSVISRLESIHLNNNDMCHVDYVDMAPRQSTLRSSTWEGPAKCWATVTPVVLDKFPRSSSAKRTVQEILAQACEFVGLPRPKDIWIGKGSHMLGVPSSPSFVVRRKPNEKPRPYTHVRLFFSEPINGPVLLGAGRHMGLGLFKPLHDSQEKLNAAG